MTCEQALALARGGSRARAAAHLDRCPACGAQIDLEEHALALARAAFAIPIPADHAEQVIRAALTAPAPTRGAWWTLALPIAWRAAVGLNLASALTIGWLLVHRGPSPAAASPPALAPSGGRDALEIDGLLEAEVGAMFTGVLGPSDGGAP